MLFDVVEAEGEDLKDDVHKDFFPIGLFFVLHNYSHISRIISSSLSCSLSSRSNRAWYSRLSVMRTHPRECEGLVPKWMRIPDLPLTLSSSGMGFWNRGERVITTLYVPAGMT